MMNSNEVTRMTSITDDQLQDIFEYHPWDGPKVERGIKVKLSLMAAFRSIIENVPPCPDRSDALRKIRDARMAANSAITHEGKY